MRTYEIRKRLEQLAGLQQAAEDRKKQAGAVAWLEAQVEEHKRQFNSPEAVAARKREYEELLRRGEQFKRACYEKWRSEGKL